MVQDYDTRITMKNFIVLKIEEEQNMNKTSLIIPQQSLIVGTKKPKRK